MMNRFAPLFAGAVLTLSALCASAQQTTQPRKFQTKKIGNVPATYKIDMYAAPDENANVVLESQEELNVTVVISRSPTKTKLATFSRPKSNDTWTLRRQNSCAGATVTKSSAACIATILFFATTAHCHMSARLPFVSSTRTGK